MNCGHGGDIQSFIDKYGKQPLDFSANISPLGVPEAVKKAICLAAEECDKYPDPFCRELRAELSAFYHIPKQYILCGNGAGDLIYKIAYAQKPKYAVITAPTFSEYENALKAVECNVYHYLLSESSGFILDKNICSHITEETDIVILCQPNNPTGILTEKNIITEILNKCVKTDTLLVIDECFLDFNDACDDYSMLAKVTEYNNLIILKAFTKLYAMAGVRLGYCMCSDISFLDKMSICGQPWAVSVIAQKAGITALKQNEYVKSVRELVKNERSWLKRELEKCGFTVLDGQANFLLFKAYEGLDKRLEDKAVIIRKCENFIGLGSQWFRVAVKTKEENQLLIKAIKEVSK